MARFVRSGRIGLECRAGAGLKWFVRSVRFGGACRLEPEWLVGADRLGPARYVRSLRLGAVGRNGRGLVRQVEMNRSGKSVRIRSGLSGMDRIRYVLLGPGRSVERAGEVCHVRGGLI